MSDYVISGDSYDESRFPIKNVLTWSIPEVYVSIDDSRFANYWLAPDNSQGHFILKFDQPRTIDTITLVNTFNGGFNGGDSGTNEFKVRQKTLSRAFFIIFIEYDRHFSV